MSHRKHKLAGLTTGMVFGILACAALVINHDRPITQSYIVQGQDLSTIKAAVEAVGGEITHELGIINAVGARLSDAKLKDMKIKVTGREAHGGHMRISGHFYNTREDIDKLLSNIP